MRNVEIRIHAIKLVQEFEPVLTDEQFVNFTAKAARLISDDEGVTTLKKALFGKDEFTLDNDMRRYTLQIHILTDATMPTNVRIWYSENGELEKERWEEFKKEFKN